MDMPILLLNYLNIGFFGLKKEPFNNFWLQNDKVLNYNKLLLLTDDLKNILVLV